MTCKARHIAPLLLAALTAGSAACPAPAEQQTSNLARPQDIATVCVDARRGVSNLVAIPPDECNLGTDSVIGFVTNGQLGDIAVADILGRRFLDTDPFIPGFTRHAIGGQPLRIVAGSTGEYVYVTNVGTSSLDRLEVAGLSLDLTRQQLPGRPADVRVGSVDGADVAWVALPDEGVVVEVPLGEAFGTVAPGDLPSIETGGTPRRLAVATGEGTDATELWVGHTTVAHVTLIDPVARAVVQSVPFAPACRDGLDNDGDGAIDAADDGCDRLSGESEEPELDLEAPPACSNGIDDDGDGSVDFPDDAGCASPSDQTEHSHRPHCSDGFDNDGDGLVDLDDPDCGELADGPSELPQCADGEDNDGDGAVDAGNDGSKPNDPDCVPFGPFTARQNNAEGTYPTTCDDALDNDGDGTADAAQVATDVPVDPRCPTPWTNAEARPRCDNGVDDDGDGLADDEDPDCYSRADDSEAPLTADPVADLALSPDGRWLYVTDQARSVVEVIDTEARAWVHVTEQADDLAELVLRAGGVTGVPLPSTPLAVTFAPSRIVSATSEQATQTAFVPTASGQVFLIDATVSDEPRHQLRGVEAEGTLGQVSQPDLTIAGESFAQGLSVNAEFANLGAFRTEPQTGFFYGVQLADDARRVQSETWSVTHQGVVYDRATTRTASLLTADGLFHDPYADFCSAGVQAGDVLVIEPGYRVNCQAPGSAAHWVGDRFEIPILEVRNDTLVLSPEGARGVVDEQLDEEPGCGQVQEDIVVLPGADATPHPTCFPSIGGYRVRVPQGVYTVVGSRTGFLHPVIELGGQCVVDDAADPRLTGRAFQSEVVDPGAVQTCALPLPSDAFNDRPFQNVAIAFTIRPGCCDSGEQVTLVQETPRDLRWRFNVSSAFAATTLLGGTLPQTIRYSALSERLLIVDQGLALIRPFLPATLEALSVLF